MTPEEMKQLSKYKSHKIVRAGKILDIGNGGTEGTFELEIYAGHTIEEKMPADWIERHNPVIGGYIIVYEDDYVSFSPNKAFVEGYSLYETQI